MARRLAVLGLLISSLFIVSIGAVSAQSTSPSSSSPVGQTDTNTTQNQEQAQPDNQNVQITFLTPGEVEQGELGKNISATLFGFDGSQGDVVTITMTQITDGFDPYLVLLGPRGEVVAHDDDSGRTSLSAEISNITLPTNGSYLIVASTYFAVDHASDDPSLKAARQFDIEVTGAHAAVNDPDYSETRAQLYSGDLTVGTSTDGYSNADEPVYYYFLEASASQNLDIVVTQADFDTLLMIFDHKGDRIGLNDDDPNGGLTSALRDFHVPEDGYYLVMITALGYYELDSTYTGGNFSLSVEPAK